MDGRTYQVVIGAIITHDDDGVPSLREDIDAESLKTVTTSAKEHADGLEIPDELYAFAFDKSLTDFVDEVLGEQEL